MRDNQTRLGPVNSPLSALLGNRRRPRLLAPLGLASLGCVLLPSLAWGQAAVPPAGQPSALPPRETVLVPGGTFKQGAGDGGSRSVPGVDTTLPPFRMDKTEVTVEAYSACTRAGACTPAAVDRDCTGLINCRPFRGCNTGKPGREKDPINCVDWKQAKAYCAWEGKRLPTNAEWEYAARGTDGRTFPWGFEAPYRFESPQLRACWNRGDQGTCPVGSYPQSASPFGLLDMAGNVYEWTGDTALYTSYRGGFAFPNTTGYNLRGGDTGITPRELRVDRTWTTYPEMVGEHYGFRCAQDLSPSEQAAVPTAPTRSAPVAPSSLCEDPGPKPPVPSCQRYTLNASVGGRASGIGLGSPGGPGGGPRTSTTPNLPCANDPQWAVVDAWQAKATTAEQCAKAVCAGSSALKATPAMCVDLPPEGVACPGGKLRPLSCEGVLPPLREGTGAMARIPGGTFEMGAKEAGAPKSETPAHAVQVSTFWMDRTEVTTDAYARCVSEGGCTPAATTEGCNAGKAGHKQEPINCVNWDQAKAYCGWAGKRLPTEEEWERAARGLEGRPLAAKPTAPGGYGDGGACLARSPAYGTCEVGLYTEGVTNLGLHDLVGNVAEWTASSYTDDYTQTPKDDAKVTRGTSWGSNANQHRTMTQRGKAAPGQQGSWLGFRCAR